MNSLPNLNAVVFFLLLGTVHSFAGRGRVHVDRSRTRLPPNVASLPNTIHTLPRGGAMTSSSTTTSSSALSSLPAIGAVAEAVTAGLQSGPYGVLALSAVVASVVTPLTLYRRFYAISVGYGFGVAAAGLALATAFPAVSGTSALLASACMFYGVRLGGYVLVRQAVRDQPSAIKNGSIFERLSFAATLSLFYGFMTTPALYAMRNPVPSSTLATGGMTLAWFGAILEAVADLQKLIVKQRNKDSSSNQFVGPTSGAYLLSRHPNYLGEILFWIGLFVGGLPSFGSSIPAYVCSSLGLLGILSIMSKATSGLEGRQQEKYGGQEKFDSWKKKVKYSLIPFLK